MNPDVGPLTRQFLKRCGYRDAEIDKYNVNTRVYQDMGLYGDDAIDLFDALAEIYHVDMSGFSFEKYFPPEFYHSLSPIKFLRWFLLGQAENKKYPEISLNMIEHTLSVKRWEFY